MTHPVDSIVVDIRLQIAAEWYEIALWSQLRAYGKLASLFQIVRSRTLYNPPPNTGPQMHRLVIYVYVEFRVVIYVSATDYPIHFMYGSRVCFRGRRIKWHYFWFDQTYGHDGMTYDMT